MLSALVRKEILSNLLNLRFVLVYALCLFLIVTGGVFLIVGYTTDKREYELNTNLYERQSLAAGNFWEFFRDGKLARPPAMMSVLAVGGEKEADGVVPAMKQNDLPVFRAELHRNPVSVLFPSMDMIFVVGIVFSLLVFMLTHDAVAGEREEGTLRVLLSGPVPRDLVLLGKWLGGYASVLMPFLTGFVLVVTILYFTPGVTIHPQDWLRIGALLALSCLYVAVIFSIALAFSVVFRQSTTSSVALLVVWAVGIVAWPAGTPYLAHVLSRPPTTAQTELEITELALFSSPWEKRWDEARRTLLGGKRDQDLTEEERRLWRAAGERLEYDSWKLWIDTMRVEAGKLTAGERAPVALAEALARASPFGCFQNAGIRIAGTGIDREEHLRQTVAEYVRSAWGYAIERLKKGDESPMMTRSIPRIRYGEPRAATALAGCGLDVALLAVVGVLAFMLAYVLFLRMDVT